jgi:hypothetical protein
VSSQLHAPASLPTGKESPGTHWIGSWVGPRPGLDVAQKRKFLTLLGLKTPTERLPISNKNIEYFYHLQNTQMLLRVVWCRIEATLLTFIQRVRDTIPGTVYSLYVLCTLKQSIATSSEINYSFLVGPYMFSRSTTLPELNYVPQN